MPTLPSQKKGYKLYATGGTAKFLTENGVENTRVFLMIDVFMVVYV